MNKKISGRRKFKNTYSKKILHCEDGPAVENFITGEKEWWINGVKIADNEEDFNKYLKMKMFW